MDITTLKKLDLSDKDIKIYLKLLEYGAASVRILAEAADLNRGTTYDILKKLQVLGLVSFYHQDTKQKFVAEDPEKLLKIIKNKKEELNDTKERIEEILPELRSLKEKDGDRPITKLYEGREGIKFILEDILSSMDGEAVKEYYIYSATNVSDDVNNAFPNFTKERIKRGISVKAISLANGGGTYGQDERRWLGTNEESATFILIYAGKCAFISRDASGNPVGVIIENQRIYETQKVIFMNLWSKLD